MFIVNMINSYSTDIISLAVRGTSEGDKRFH